MNIPKAIQILANKATGSRDKAAAVVAQQLTTKFDADGIEEWVHNGEYDGNETITSLQGEIDELENS